uniref:Transporter-associated domain-containing protein n=1 Tax=Bosea sp. NBC_00436 TaxID=2969620 RepID=A0A9E7ZZ71_9HYPH
MLVLDQFKTVPVRRAVVIDEYGGLDGIVTQTELLEAIAGDPPDVEGEEPDMVEHEDGSLLIGGRCRYIRRSIGWASGPNRRRTPYDCRFGAIRIGHIPEVGERFSHEVWRFEIADMDGRRIDKLFA